MGEEGADMELAVEQWKKPKTIAAVVMACASLLLLAAFFLPYVTATEEYAQALSSLPQQVPIDDSGLTPADIKDLSLMEFAKLTYELAQGSRYDWILPNAILYFFVGGCSAVVLLLAVFRRPILTTLTSCVAALAIFIVRWDFDERSAFPNSSYDWGIVQWLYPIALALVIAGSIAYFVICRKEKKVQKALIAQAANEDQEQASMAGDGE